MSETTTTEYNVRLPNGQLVGSWVNQLSGAQSAASRARISLEQVGAVNQKIDIVKRTVTTNISATVVDSEVWANPIPQELPTLPAQEPTA